MNYSTYFQSSKDYFWQWEEHGKVIAIPKDQTIAYVGLVQDILAAIYRQGLPPFGALILTVIATNSNGSQGLESVQHIMAKKGLFASEVSDSMNFLKLLTDLPPEYKTGEKKVLLLQAIFEKCHHILSIKHSRSIYKAFSSRDDVNFPEFNASPVLREQRELDVNFVYRDFRTLQIMNNKFKSVQDILDGMAGFKKVPTEIEIEEIETLHEDADLVDQLVHNSKTFHVGSLVKRIWSGLNIPVHSTIPSQQPIGGVSDLTNKGEFDKLLISEFANDDDVFMSRLANNEALYIHREIPPSNNDLKRVILIDASLKNWGTPKTVSFATMLAIARHPKTDIECEAFVIGKGHHPVSISDIHGIINGLEILAGSLNAAEGLESYVNEFPPDASREIFLITEPSTLKQSAMLQMVNEYQSAIHYWIYTDAEGNIDVYKKQQNSKKHLQHLRLPLNELWKRSGKKQVEPVKPENDLYPILTDGGSGGSKIKAVIPVDGTVYQIMTSRTLLKLYKRQNDANQSKAWEVIYENLPFTSEFAEIGIHSNGDCLLAMYSPHTKYILLINTSKNISHTVPMRKWRPIYGQAFLFQDDQFHYKDYQNNSVSIDIEGQVKHNAMIDGKLFHERLAEISAVRQERHSHNGVNVLKNIQQVFINQRNYLVVNSHELIVDQADILKLQVSAFTDAKIRAVQYAKGAYRFDDGSSVRVAKPCILILKSSDDNLPVIYIPSVVDKSLGAAAGNVFAGSPYYMKDGMPTITTHEFYVNYISAFIRTILNHGT